MPNINDIIANLKTQLEINECAKLNWVETIDLINVLEFLKERASDADWAEHQLVDLGYCHYV